MKTLKEFVETEKQRIDQEKEKALSESGYVPFFKIDEGESILKFKDDEPRENEQYENRMIFRVISFKDNKEFDLSVNIKSPLYKDIISNLSEGYTTLKILRVGTTKEDTRYSVKAVS